MLERVYVGRIDRSRLALTDVLDRIESALEASSSFRLVPETLHEGSTYCQFDIVRVETNKDPTDEDDQPNALVAPVSGLEVIRKLYHNVTWKGCKLQVEAAKPHYLERLALERAERLQQQTTCAEDDSHKTDRTRQEVGLPRHLKIKRAYGQESWKVDTKPFHVKDWNEALSSVKTIEGNTEFRAARIGFVWLISTQISVYPMYQ